VDFTTSTVPAFLAEGEVKSSAGLRRMLEAGVPVTQITFTSDGQGSLPSFDAQGTLQRLEIGRVTSLFGEVRDAVRDEGVPLDTALATITANPARLLKLRGKGQIAEGADADLVLVEPAGLTIAGVIAKGRWLMRDGRLLAKGTFEW
jgi:beta-aspartyl-dipeptidase (metallo-type)